MALFSVRRRFLDALIVALLVALATLFLAARKREPRPERAGSRDWQERLLAELVVSNSRKDTIALSHVHAGMCRYVIVVSVGCGFSRRLESEWVVLELNDSGPIVPEGWQAFWLTLEGPSLASDFFDSRFPVEYLSSVRDAGLSRHAEIVGVPFFIVLDRQGTVRQSGLGGELYSRRSFKPDCTIRKEPPFMIGRQRS